ncbi:MAG: hypothetical protein KAS77_00620, partial [Thermoplasmata archaeon]|nr:hypothetical protein [Thermoplasmata archaeon]
VTLEVENSGQTTANDILVQFYLDGLPYGQPLFITSLDPETVQNLTTSWSANVTGLHEISVEVDSTKDVDETREDNNRAAVQVNVEQLDYQTQPGPGITMALVALAILALAAVRRRRQMR